MFTKLNKEKLKQVYIIALITIFLLLFLVEVLGHFDIVLGKSGIILWLTSFVLILIFVFYELIFLIKFSYKEKSFFSLFVIATIFIGVLFYANQAANLNFETTQQLTCSISQIKELDDAGYTETCFLGYPSRQYYVPTFVAELGNRSYLSMNIGNTVYFFMGLIVFCASLLRYIKSTARVKDIITAILLVIPFHFYFFNFLVLTFEQSMFPLSFAFFLSGLFINLFKKENTIQLIILSYILLYSIWSYTPALSLVFFGLVILFYLYYKYPNVKNQIVIGSCIFIIIINIIISFASRADDKFLAKDYDYSKLINVFKELVTGIFLGEGYVNLYSMFIYPFIIIFFLLFLSKYYRWKSLVFIVWFFGVYITATIFEGYNTSSYVVVMKRTGVVIPVLVATVSLPLNNIKPQIQKWYKYFVVSFILITIFAIRFNISVYNQKTQGIEFEKQSFIISINRILKNTTEANILYIGNEIHTIGSIQNAIGYLSPGSVVTVTEFCFEQKTNVYEYSLLIFESRLNCKKLDKFELVKSYDYEYLGSYEIYKNGNSF